MKIKILRSVEGGPQKGEIVRVRELNSLIFGKYQVVEDGPHIGIIISSISAMPISNDEPRTISDLVSIAHANAIEKGWHLEPRSFGDVIALMHSELSEALEDYRHGFGVTETYFEDDKPCGIPTELADTVIRIFDACGYYGIDLQDAITKKMVYNATRPARHGGKVL